MGRMAVGIAPEKNTWHVDWITLAHRGTGGGERGDWLTRSFMLFDWAFARASTSQTRTLNESPSVICGFLRYITYIHTQEHYSHDDDAAVVLFPFENQTAPYWPMHFQSHHIPNTPLTFALVIIVCGGSTKSQAMHFINSPVVHRSRMMNSQSHLLL